MTGLSFTHRGCPHCGQPLCSQSAHAWWPCVGLPSARAGRRDIGGVTDASASPSAGSGVGALDADARASAPGPAPAGPDGLAVTHRVLSQRVVLADRGSPTRRRGAGSGLHPGSNPGAPARRRGAPASRPRSRRGAVDHCARPGVGAPPLLSTHAATFSSHVLHRCLRRDSPHRTEPTNADGLCGPRVPAWVAGVTSLTGPDPGGRPGHRGRPSLPWTSGRGRDRHARLLACGDVAVAGDTAGRRA